MPYANNVVFLMDPKKPQMEGNITLCSPGGKLAINVAETEAANIMPGITGICHYPGRPSGIQAQGVSGQFVPASGANSNFGGSGRPVQIAAYPTYYQGANAPLPSGATPIG